MRILAQEFVNHPWWFALIVAGPVVTFLFLLGLYLGHNPNLAPVIFVPSAPKPAPIYHTYILAPRSQPSISKETTPKLSSPSSSVSSSSSAPSPSPRPSAPVSPTPSPNVSPTHTASPTPTVSASPSPTDSTPAPSPTPSSAPVSYRFESGGQAYAVRRSLVRSDLQPASWDRGSHARTNDPS